MKMGCTFGKGCGDYRTLGETLRHRHHERLRRLPERKIAIYGLAHLGCGPLSRSGRLLLRKSCICIWGTHPKGIKTRPTTGLAHTERDQTSVRQCTDTLIAGSLLLAAPSVQPHDLIDIRLRAGCGHDLDHIGTMINTFLHHGLERLKRIRTLEIVVRTDEHGTALVGGTSHPLGHLFLRLDLHIHISRTGLDCPQKPLFRHLHGLDLTALLRKALQRRLRRSHLTYAAGRHQRHVGGEKFLYILCAQITSVQTDLRHLAHLKSLMNLLQTAVLYSSTNHLLTSII